MKGKPKFLNTKEDYLNLLAMDESIVTKEEKKEALTDLLANVKDWIFVKELASKEEGVEDETHKIVESEVYQEEPAEGEPAPEPQFTYAQYEFKKNPGARLFLLGFTVDEVNALIQQIDATE